MNNLPTAEQLHNWQCFINDWEISLKRRKVPGKDRTFHDFNIVEVDVHPVDNEDWVFIEFEYTNNGKKLDWYRMKIPFNELINYESKTKVNE